MLNSSGKIGSFVENDAAQFEPSTADMKEWTEEARISFGKPSYPGMYPSSCIADVNHDEKRRIGTEENDDSCSFLSYMAPYLRQKTANIGETNADLIVGEPQQLTSNRIEEIQASSENQDRRPSPVEIAVQPPRQQPFEKDAKVLRQRSRFEERQRLQLESRARLSAEKAAYLEEELVALSGQMQQLFAEKEALRIALERDHGTTHSESPSLSSVASSVEGRNSASTASLSYTSSSSSAEGRLRGVNLAVMKEPQLAFASPKQLEPRLGGGRMRSSPFGETISSRLKHREQPLSHPSSQQHNQHNQHNHHHHQQQHQQHPHYKPWHSPGPGPGFVHGQVRSSPGSASRKPPQRVSISKDDLDEDETEDSNYRVQSPDSQLSSDSFLAADATSKCRDGSSSSSGVWSTNSNTNSHSVGGQRHSSSNRSISSNNNNRSNGDGHSKNSSSRSLFNSSPSKLIGKIHDSSSSSIMKPKSAHMPFPSMQPGLRDDEDEGGGIFEAANDVDEDNDKDSDEDDGTVVDDYSADSTWRWSPGERLPRTRAAATVSEDEPEEEGGDDSGRGRGPERGAGSRGEERGRNRRRLKTGELEESAETAIAEVLRDSRPNGLQESSSSSSSFAGSTASVGPPASTCHPTAAVESSIAASRFGLSAGRMPNSGRWHSAGGVRQEDSSIIVSDALASPVGLARSVEERRLDYGVTLGVRVADGRFERGARASVSSVSAVLAGAAATDGGRSARGTYAPSRTEGSSSRSRSQSAPARGMQLYSGSEIISNAANAAADAATVELRADNRGRQLVTKPIKPKTDIWARSTGRADLWTGARSESRERAAVTGTAAVAVAPRMDPVLLQLSYVERHYYNGHARPRSASPGTGNRNGPRSSGHPRPSLIPVPISVPAPDASASPDMRPITISPGVVNRSRPRSHSQPRPSLIPVPFTATAPSMSMTPSPSVPPRLRVFTEDDGAVEKNKPSKASFEHETPATSAVTSDAAATIAGAATSEGLSSDELGSEKDQVVASNTATIATIGISSNGSSGNSGLGVGSDSRGNLEAEAELTGAHASTSEEKEVTSVTFTPSSSTDRRRSRSKSPGGSGGGVSRGIRAKSPGGTVSSSSSIATTPSTTPSGSTSSSSSIMFSSPLRRRPLIPDDATISQKAFLWSKGLRCGDGDSSEQVAAATTLSSPSTRVGAGAANQKSRFPQSTSPSAATRNEHGGKVSLAVDKDGAENNGSTGRDQSRGGKIEVSFDGGEAGGVETGSSPSSKGGSPESVAGLGPGRRAQFTRSELFDLNRAKVGKARCCITCYALSICKACSQEDEDGEGDIREDSQSNQDGERFGENLQNEQAVEEVGEDAAGGGGGGVGGGGSGGGGLLEEGGVVTKEENVKSEASGGASLSESDVNRCTEKEEVEGQIEQIEEDYQLALEGVVATATTALVGDDSRQSEKEIDSKEVRPDGRVKQRDAKTEQEIMRQDDTSAEASITGAGGGGGGGLEDEPKFDSGNDEGLSQSLLQMSMPTRMQTQATAIDDVSIAPVDSEGNAIQTVHLSATPLAPTPFSTQLPPVTMDVAGTAPTPAKLDPLSLEISNMMVKSMLTTEFKADGTSATGTGTWVPMAGSGYIGAHITREVAATGDAAVDTDDATDSKASVTGVAIGGAVVASVVTFREAFRAGDDSGSAATEIDGVDSSSGDVDDNNLSEFVWTDVGDESVDDVIALNAVQDRIHQIQPRSSETDESQELKEPIVALSKPETAVDVRDIALVEVNGQHMPSALPAIVADVADVPGGTTDMQIDVKRPLDADTVVSDRSAAYDDTDSAVSERSVALDDADATVSGRMAACDDADITVSGRNAALAPVTVKGRSKAAAMDAFAALMAFVASPASKIPPAAPSSAGSTPYARPATVKPIFFAANPESKITPPKSRGKKKSAPDTKRHCGQTSNSGNSITFARSSRSGSVGKRRHPPDSDISRKPNTAGSPDTPDTPDTRNTPEDQLSGIDSSVSDSKQQGEGEGKLKSPERPPVTVEFAHSKIQSSPNASTIASTSNPMRISERATSKIPLSAPSSGPSAGAPSSAGSSPAPKTVAPLESPVSKMTVSATRPGACFGTPPSPSLPSLFDAGYLPGVTDSTDAADATGLAAVGNGLGLGLGLSSDEMSEALVSDLSVVEMMASEVSGGNPNESIPTGLGLGLGLGAEDIERPGAGSQAGAELREGGRGGGGAGVEQEEVARLNRNAVSRSSYKDRERGGAVNRNQDKSGLAPKPSKPASVAGTRMSLSERLMRPTQSQLLAVEHLQKQIEQEYRTDLLRDRQRSVALSGLKTPYPQSPQSSRSVQFTVRAPVGSPKLVTSPAKTSPATKSAKSIYASPPHPPHPPQFNHDGSRSVTLVAANRLKSCSGSQDSTNSQESGDAFKGSCKSSSGSGESSPTTITRDTHASILGRKNRKSTSPSYRQASIVDHQKRATAQQSSAAFVSDEIRERLFADIQKVAVDGINVDVLSSSKEILTGQHER